MNFTLSIPTDLQLYSSNDMNDYNSRKNGDFWMEFLHVCSNILRKELSFFKLSKPSQYLYFSTDGK